MIHEGSFLASLMPRILKCPCNRISQVTFSKSSLFLDNGIVQSNPALYVLLRSSPGSELGSKLDPRESG